MPFTIDQSYRKDKAHPAGHGYGRMVGGAWIADRGGLPSSIVVHSTNGRKGSSLAGEAKYLRDSPGVSCHDLIGKDGTIVEILPTSAVAWHAGAALGPWDNFASIGIELHHAVGDTYPAAQIDALTERVQQFIAIFGITRDRIETHRAIALPKGRKVDPSDMTDHEFYVWRSGLYQPDWADLWGTTAPYHPEYGIPTTWRDSHLAGKPLGKALADELQADGFIVQPFERGYITWTVVTGTTVRDWQ